MKALYRRALARIAANDHKLPIGDLEKVIAYAGSRPRTPRHLNPRPMAVVGALPGGTQVLSALGGYPAH